MLNHRHRVVLSTSQKYFLHKTVGPLGMAASCILKFENKNTSINKTTDL